MDLLQRSLQANSSKLTAISSILRISIVFFTITFLLVLAFNALRSTDINEPVYAGEILGASTSKKDLLIEIKSPSGSYIVLTPPIVEEIKVAEVKYTEKLRKQEEERKREEERQRRIRQEKINAINAYLIRQGSPMAPYSELIIQVCEEYGTHYCKFFMSIAGVESGLGRICPPHNAWGWGHASYPSWEYSIPYVASKIAHNYYYKGYDSFEELAYSPYGPVNEEKWIQNLYFFYNSMPSL